MKMLAVLLSLTLSAFATQPMPPPSSPKPMTPTPSPTPQAPSPDLTQPPQVTTCDELSLEEQQFAAQLSVSNKALFCSIFDEEQRQEAMDLVKGTAAANPPLSADNAVSQVAQQYGLSPTSPAGTCGG